MKINSKTAYRFKKFVGNGDKPGLDNVLVEEGRMVATDGMKLLMIEEENKLEGDSKTFNLKDFVETYKSVDKEVEVEMKEGVRFPEYRRILPKEGEEKICVRVNAKLLIDALEQFKGGEGLVDLRIFGELSPIMLSKKEGDKKTTAIVMPVIK